MTDIEMTREGPEKGTEKDRRSKVSPADWGLLFLCTFLLAAAVVFRLLYSPVLVSGSSMEPTYHNGDILLTGKVTDETDLAVGDVVAFKGDETHGSSYIKRIMALPGDTVQIVNGILYVNHVPQETDFDRMVYSGRANTMITVPKGQYFVLGDNRNRSDDSRLFGFVAREDIKLKVKRKLFQMKAK